MGPMKLPDLPVEQPGPVEGYQSVEYAEREKGNAGQVLGHHIAASADALETLALSVTEGQQRVQVLTARKNEQALHTATLTALNQKQTISEDELGQYYGGVANIPKDVLAKIPGGTKVKFNTPDGVTHENGRSDIPMYAVRADLYRHMMEPNIDNLAKGIDEPGWRRAFTLGSKLDLENQVQDVAKRSAYEAIQHVNQVAITQFEEATKIGDWASAELALKMGGSTIMPAQREIMERHLETAKSVFVPNEILAGTDTERMKSLVTGLSNVTTNQGKFKVTDAYGQTEDVDTSKLTEAQRRSFVRFAGQRIHTIENADKGQESAQQKARWRQGMSVLNNAWASGDLNTIKNFPAIMQQSGLGNEMDPEKWHQLNDIAAHLAKESNPKIPKPKPNNFALSALQSAASQRAHGQAVTTVNPETGKPFDFDSEDWSTAGFLMRSNAYSLPNQRNMDDQINGKPTTDAQTEKMVGQVSKMVSGHDMDEVNAMPKGQRRDALEQEYGNTRQAIQLSAQEFLASHKGSATPEQWSRWQQGYLKETALHPDISQPNTAWLGGTFSTTAFKAKPGDVPGRTLMAIQANHARFGIPDNYEEQDAFYKAYVQPYKPALAEEYKKRFPNKSAEEDFFIAAGATIRDNQAKFAAEKKTTAKEVAKRVMDSLAKTWNPDG